MKKMKFAALFAAFVSVFGFTSCLNDNGDDAVREYQSLVTVESSMGYTVLYADEYPHQALYPTNASLVQFGITSTTRRAMVVYTVPEGQDLTGSKVNVNVTNGQAWPVKGISHRPDTCETYTDPMMSFSDYAFSWAMTFKSVNVARNRYLNIGYQYKPYSKVARTVLVPNRVGNDTLYLDFKMKKMEQGEGSPQIFMDTYDLSTCPFEYLEQLTPVQDSMYVTVVGRVSEYGGSRKESVTTRCRTIAGGGFMPAD